MTKVYNLKNKSPEEVINTYKKISINSKLPKTIWKLTGNYEKALELFQASKNNKKQNKEQ
jgi:hypothetical protein